jgi:putative endonuclease
MNNLGRIAEKIAQKFLIKKGYEIIETNYWLKRYGEIDIIAKKGNVYYFYEVKALKSNLNFDPSVHYTKEKRDKLKKLILYYTNMNNIDEYIRGLIAVEIGKKIKIKKYENV